MELISKLWGAIADFFASMSPYYAVAQIIGFIGVGTGILIYSGRTRAHILICKFISDVLWFVNYVMIGAYTGALLNLIAMARETVFYNRGVKRWASHRIWLYVFILLTFLSPMFEWIKLGGFSWLPLLPATGSVLAVISFYSASPRVMRYFGFASQIFWLTYGIMLVNVSSVVCGSLTVISAVIGMVREARAKRKPEKADAKNA